MRLYGVVFLALVLSTNNLVMAAFDVDDFPRERVFSTNSLGDVCVIPEHFPDVEYAKKDEKHENELCGLLDEDSKIAICPKVSSTNPGLEFFVLDPKLNREKFEQENCGSQNESSSSEPKSYSKFAKYKLSTSCSYTPSILAYYHLSRVLGNVGNVTTVVLRTMDRNKHIEYANKALQQTSKRPNDIINQTWAGLLGLLKSTTTTPRVQNVMTSDLRHSYGALIFQPKKTEFYSEFYNKAKAGEHRADAFRERNPYYLMLKKSEPIENLVPKHISQENVQKIVSLKDMSDMILLDYILSQQDRFGNTNYKIKYYKANQSEASGWDFEKKDKLEDKDKGSGYFAIKELVLKDNDCGITKENVAKNYNLLNFMNHMSAETYQKFKQFVSRLNRSDIKLLFTKELLFSEKDYAGFVKLASGAYQLLESKCKSGELKLDLDVEPHFFNNEANRTCE